MQEPKPTLSVAFLPNVGAYSVRVNGRHVGCVQFDVRHPPFLQRVEVGRPKPY